MSAAATRIGHHLLLLPKIPNIFDIFVLLVSETG
jgi:hypothetical protein